MASRALLRLRVAAGEARREPELPRRVHGVDRSVGCRSCQSQGHGRCDPPARRRARRFGEITAVDGLDLDVPEGHLPRACSGPTAPASRRRCGCSPGRRIADAGELARPRPRAARRVRRRRGPRWGWSRSSTTSTSTSRSRTTSPSSRGSTASKDVGGAVDRALGARPAHRAPQGRGRQALGRHAPAPAAGARARARAAPAAARRADRRPRPADPHRALVADRRPARRAGRRS